MADSIIGTSIKQLPEAAQSQLNDSTDLIVEDATPTTRRTKLSTLANWIKTKLGIGTASSLQTTSKEIVGAINELNSSSVKVRTVNSWTMIEYPNNLVEMWRYATISSAANAKTNTLSLATPMKDSQYGVKISPVFNGHLCKSVWAGTKTGADGRTETTVQISMDSTDSDSNVGVFVFVTGYRAA